MRLTVLGKSPSWQDAGGACSGYLLEEDGTAILLDCGNGVFGKLRQRIDYVDVDAVVISHLHADHFLDLVPYSYALTYAPRQQPVPVDRWPGTDNPARPELHGPPGARETFRKVVGCWGNNDLIENAFDLTEYDESSELSIGPVRVTFQEVPHYTETFAMRVSSQNGSGEIVYGADSRPTEALTRFATGADLILVSYDPDQYYPVMHALLKADAAGRLRQDVLGDSNRRLSSALAARPDGTAATSPKR